MSNYTHPGQFARRIVGGIELAAHDWQGYPIMTCCRGRAACGSHTNYLPQVGQYARIDRGPGIWTIERVDERERYVELSYADVVGDEHTRTVGFERMAVVSPEVYMRATTPAELFKLPDVSEIGVEDDDD